MRLFNPGFLFGAPGCRLLPRRRAGTGAKTRRVPASTAFGFNDLLTRFERVGDHCSIIAVAIITLRHDLFDTHEYIDSLKQIKSEAFEENFDQFRVQYNIEYAQKSSPDGAAF